MHMLHKMDIHECLIFLEKQGVKDAEIIEQMGVNRSTVQRWWKTNKPTPKLLAKMQKWCGEFIPIEDHFYGKKPPKIIFEEALCNCYYTLKPLMDAKAMNDEYRYWHKYRVGAYHRCMAAPHFYDRGIQPARSRGTANALRTMSGEKVPSIENIYRIIADYHPEKRLRDYFTKLIDETIKELLHQE